MNRCSVSRIMLDNGTIIRLTDEGFYQGIDDALKMRDQCNWFTGTEAVTNVPGRGWIIERRDEE